MASSIFRPQIQHGGRTWHMTYDPAVPTTTAPDLTQFKLVALICKQVKPAREGNKPLYMVRADLYMPARILRDGTALPERYLRGFRLYDYQPASPDVVQLNELVYYLAEPMAVDGDDMQSFFDAVIGRNQADAGPSLETDWGRKLLGETPPTPAPARKTEAVDATPINMG